MPSLDAAKTFFLGGCPAPDYIGIDIGFPEDS